MYMYILYFDIIEELIVYYSPISEGRQTGRRLESNVSQIPMIRGGVHLTAPAYLPNVILKEMTATEEQFYAPPGRSASRGYDYGGDRYASRRPRTATARVGETDPERRWAARERAEPAAGPEARGRPASGPRRAALIYV